MTRAQKKIIILCTLVLTAAGFTHGMEEGESKKRKASLISGLVALQSTESNNNNNSSESVFYDTDVIFVNKSNKFQGHVYLSGKLISALIPGSTVTTTIHYAREARLGQEQFDSKKTATISWGHFEGENKFTPTGRESQVILTCTENGTWEKKIVRTGPSCKKVAVLVDNIMEHPILIITLQNHSKRFNDPNHTLKKEAAYQHYLRNIMVEDIAKYPVRYEVEWVNVGGSEEVAISYDPLSSQFDDLVIFKGTQAIRALQGDEEEIGTFTPTGNRWYEHIGVTAQNNQPHKDNEQYKERYKVQQRLRAVDVAINNESGNTLDVFMCDKTIADKNKPILRLTDSTDQNPRLLHIGGEAEYYLTPGQVLVAQYAAPGNSLHPEQGYYIVEPDFYGTGEKCKISVEQRDIKGNISTKFNLYL